jgi:hypothetical protein
VEVIREENMTSKTMMAEFEKWHIKRCNVRNCKNKPTTILTHPADDLLAAGLCEEHYQQAMSGDDGKFNIQVDNYDAFADERTTPIPNTRPIVERINEKFDPILAHVNFKVIDLIAIYITGFIIGWILADLLR